MKYNQYSIKINLYKIMLNGFGKEGGGGDIQIVDHSAIEKDYQAAAERGELDPEKVNARIEKLEEEHKTKELKRIRKEKSGLEHKEQSNIFISEFKRLSGEYDLTQDIEKRKRIENEIKDLLASVFSIEFARKRMSAVETSKNT